MLFRGTAAINIGLEMLKQKNMKLVWLPDTSAGLQSFQCWLEEHILFLGIINAWGDFYGWAEVKEMIQVFPHL